MSIKNEILKIQAQVVKIQQNRLDLLSELAEIDKKHPAGKDVR